MSRNNNTRSPNSRNSVPTGIKVITSLLLPKSTWDKNNIRDLRFEETHGLPPKIEAPHITRLDSFSSTDRMAEAAKLFRQAAAEVEPFEVSLKELKYFTHGQKRGFTIYLDPEITPLQNGANPLCELQRKLYTKCLEGRFQMLEDKISPSQFTPHVSLGKISSKVDLDKALQTYGTKWEVITFTVTQVQILSKLVHDTVVRHVIPLGKNPTDIAEFDPVPFPTDGTYSININWVPQGTSNEDLQKCFSELEAVKAEVVFKTIDRQDYTKGWGHVTFPNREKRDGALRKNWSINEQRLEVFPCD